MKKRTLCLLLAGTMALSLLSGCGSKKTAGEDPLNSFAADGENGGGDAGEEAGTSPVETGPSATTPDGYPLDPRWADLQPGETAVQYHNIFIKSGMTLGEAMDAVNNSGEGHFFLTTLNLTDLDEERTCLGDSSAEPEYGYVSLHGVTPIFYLYYLGNLPGEPGTTYHLRDCPIYAVHSWSSISSMPPDEVVTRIGTFGELRAMDLETIQEVVETALAGMDAELRTGELTDNGVRVTKYHYNYYRHFSWNGYTLCSAGGEDGFVSEAHFQIEIDTGKVHEKGTMYLDRANSEDALIWVPNGAAK